MMARNLGTDINFRSINTQLARPKSKLKMPKLKNIY